MIIPEDYLDRYGNVQKRGFNIPADHYVHLDLEGGGALGAAACGFLRALDQYDNIDIKSMTGTSAGALNAAAFVCGGIKSVDKLWSDIGQDGDNASCIHAASKDAHSIFMNSFNSNKYRSPLDYMRHLLEGCGITNEAIQNSDIELRVCASVMIDPNGPISPENFKKRVFTGKEITVEHILASAALENTTGPILVNGEWLWDGAYAAENNPSLSHHDKNINNNDSTPIIYLSVDPSGAPLHASSSNRGIFYGGTQQRIDTLRAATSAPVYFIDLNHNNLFPESMRMTPTSKNIEFIRDVGENAGYYFISNFEADQKLLSAADHKRDSLAEPALTL